VPLNKEANKTFSHSPRLEIQFEPCVKDERRRTKMWLLINFVES